ncbi:MAG: hypothetical protein UY20_C0002G0038 [Candidatus Yanofskybacteria bacterium GW2011_GWA1_48_10]|uniref:Uncharacterized protein n=2 Tax=Parcubacteria group TaxID=1794811 RepID=A0A0G1WIC0_9BACT|nr:MAG: hypothetical protein UY01_C0009G0012 [Candidatus Nomurabacteria bacterium GW2011_GWB1_47_6]KKU90058.1 MAG: hypothetical protein UY20_C0002G0038 [Candidatus Yanofskybacteria bacterium GW2011_GWA1_48_10]
MKFAKLSNLWAPCFLKNWAGPPAGPSLVLEITIRRLVRWQASFSSHLVHDFQNFLLPFV